MDLNHIFLFTAVVSSLLVLARAWRPGGVFRGWRIAAIIVLAVTGVSWFFCRQYAGFVGGGVWFVLLFLPMMGLGRASKLADQGRYQSAARLARMLRTLHSTAQLREQAEIFERLAEQQGPALEIEDEGLAQSIFRRLRTAPAVVFIILVNIGVYCIELYRQALNNPVALHRLGALDYHAVLNRGEFWRLFAALFLHYNPVHLIFNLVALYVIGPPLEKIIGSLRFAFCYLAAGIGSTAGVILFTFVRIKFDRNFHPADLVGASGCIMGIVGMWAGFLLRHRHIWQARQRLLNILFIIIIQVVFDVVTPQVSTSAHLCGLITGFVIGLSVRAKARPF